MFIYTAHSYKHVLKGYHTTCHISYYYTVYIYIKHSGHSETQKRLAPCTLCLHDFLFAFVFLVSKEHLDLMKLFGFAGTLAMLVMCLLVSDSSHSYLMWLHNLCQGDLGQWKCCWRWKAARARSLSSPVDRILSLAGKKCVSLMKTFSHAHVHVPDVTRTQYVHYVSLCFQGFDKSVCWPDH